MSDTKGGPPTCPLVAPIKLAPPATAMRKALASGGNSTLLAITFRAAAPTPMSHTLPGRSLGALVATFFLTPPATTVLDAFLRCISSTFLASNYNTSGTTTMSFALQSRRHSIFLTSFMSTLTSCHTTGSRVGIFGCSRLSLFWCAGTSKRFILCLKNQLLVCYLLSLRQFGHGGHSFWNSLHERKRSS